jgi:Protein of unknown function (DUF1549)/Protein of unknown function (DUF1553)
MRLGRASVVVQAAIGLAVFAHFEAAAETAKPLVASTSTLSSEAAAKPADDSDVSDVSEQAEVARINDLVAQAWRDHHLVPSPAAVDGEWCRRVYLDLIGRVPTVAEVRAYHADRKRDKRQRLVDRLLGDEYADQYTRHWSNVWANWLVGRTGGMDRKSLVSRPGMIEYLRDSLTYNKPYDQLATELITATGSCRPGDADFNGAANFLADKMADGGVQATAQTARIFLGMAVQCTQCHNHPFNEYKQNQFWELDAFFRQTHVERQVGDDRRQRFVGRVVDHDFAGESNDPAKADLFYELRNGKLAVAYPVFVDGTSLAGLFAAKGEDFGDRGYLKDVNRRAELAKLVVASREFDQALVNRLWGRFLGYGFTKPVDDIGPHNTPSHPELLDQLGQAFREAGFDMKRLTRWIVLSEPYSLSSRMTRRNEADDPALGARPMFSHFYLRQMEAEQLYESLLVATAAADTVSEDQRAQIKQRWLQQFNTAFGTDDNGEATSFNGSIPQALTMMNSPLVRRATGNQPGSMLARIATNSGLDNAEKIRYLYLAALARRPTQPELAISNELLVARDGKVGPALQDIWWALLNSNEFILIH